MWGAVVAAIGGAADGAIRKRVRRLEPAQDETVLPRVPDFRRTASRIELDPLSHAAARARMRDGVRALVFPARFRYGAGMAKQWIAREAEVAAGGTLKFAYVLDGVPREGFLARVGGRIVAYENVCRHLPLSLDLDDNRIFTRDRKYFVCQTHGAVYEPLSGLCVQGPCAGASLKPLRVVREGGGLWLEVTDTIG